MNTSVHIELPAPAYSLSDEPCINADYCPPTDLGYGGDYGTDHTNHLGPVGSLAMLVDAPGNPADYQRAFDERTVSALRFFAVVGSEALAPRLERVRAAAHRVSTLLGDIREAAAARASERIVSEGVAGLAIDPAAVRRDISL